MPAPKGLWPMLKNAFSSWNDHEAPRLGAALAFYTVLSLSPLLLLLIAIIGLFVDNAGAVKQITGQVQGLVGDDGAAVVRATLEGAHKSKAGGVSVLSVFILLVSASGVFAELRSALNKIFDVHAEKQTGLWAMAREKFFSFGMVLTVGFLLLTSLALSAALAAAMTFFNGIVPLPSFVAAAIDIVFSTAGIAVVFALMFRYVPATRTSWRAALVGGIFTALLFTAGKYLIGFYLSKAAVGSSYGAAGSVIAVIVWVYYSAQIVFLGAEFTRAFASLKQAAVETHPSGEENKPVAKQTDPGPVPASSKVPSSGLPLVGGAVILAHAMAVVLIGARRGK